MPHNPCTVQLMLYMDFKHMMTRRIPEDGTASVTPTAANTLWHDALDPVGPPPLYPNVTRQVTAADLASQLHTFKDQHVLYLNSMPQVRGAAEEGAVQACSGEGACWPGMHGAESSTPIAERVRRYIYECGDPTVTGFGIPEDVLQNLTMRVNLGLSS